MGPKNDNGKMKRKGSVRVEEDVERSQALRGEVRRTFSDSYHDRPSTSRIPTHFLSFSHPAPRTAEVQPFQLEVFTPTLPSNIEDFNEELIFFEQVEQQQPMGDSRVTGLDYSVIPLIDSLIENQTGGFTQATNLSSSHEYSPQIEVFLAPYLMDSPEPRTYAGLVSPSQPSTSHQRANPVWSSPPPQQPPPSHSFCSSHRASTSNSPYQRESCDRLQKKQEKKQPGRPREHFPVDRDIRAAIREDRSNRYNELSPEQQTKKAKERLANNYAVNRSREKKFEMGQEVLEIISALMENKNKLAYQRFSTWKQHKKNKTKNIIETLRDLLPKKPNAEKGKGKKKKESEEEEEKEDEEDDGDRWEEGGDGRDGDSADEDPDDPPHPPPSMPPNFCCTRC